VAGAISGDEVTAIPLYGFVAGDSLGVLVVVDDHDTIAELGHRLSQAAAVRVAPRPGACVYARGKRLDGDATVHDAGLCALDRVDLAPGGLTPNGGTGSGGTGDRRPSEDR
jgi:hypothetical protein